MSNEAPFRQGLWDKPIVTAQSSDQEILDAINKAGDNRLPWRKHDWPKDGSNTTKAWVRPSDIGFSDKRDTALLKRMRQMVKAGLLEERPVGVSTTEQRTWDRGIITTYRRMFPRFRVIPRDTL